MGIITGEKLESLEAETAEMVARAVKFGEESAYPEPEETLKDVFS
jgi:TPP-dependent pyruvate/acetoin dehydrogenase alpha subunit